MYDPLERVEGQAFIRLVKVEPELHGSGLVQVQMKHSNVFADYSAVSYMWGEQAERHRILINNRLATVGNNLYEHLCSLRTFEEGQWYWVDALSIDQQNPIERSQQVKLMAEIFEGARDVLAFVPPDTEHGIPLSPPFQTLAERSVTYEHSKKISELKTVSPSGESEVQSSEKEPVPAFEELRVAVEAICRSKYWHRTWIIQEIALARRLYLTDGQIKIAWDSLFESIDMLRNFIQQSGLRYSVPQALSNLQDVRKGTRRSTLAALVSDFSSSQCSDFHDKVYGLLSLLQNGHRYPVDYNTNEMEFFLGALQFGQGPGADFDAEAQAFVLARTLFQSLPLKAGIVVKQAKAASDMLYVRCRASRFPLKQSQVSCGRQRSYICPNCSYKTLDFDTRSYSTMYCLDLDGSHQHLISEELDSPVESQKDRSDQVQMAVVIMVVEPAPKNTQTRLDDLFDWEQFSSNRYWRADFLDGRKRHRVSARCHPLEQKINIPRLTGNGLFYEIELPVPVFVSMAIHETNDLDSLVFGYPSPNKLDDVVDSLVQRGGLRRLIPPQTTEADTGKSSSAAPGHVVPSAEVP